MAYGSVKVDQIITSTQTVTVDNFLNGSAGSVTNTMLAGSIANGKLANSNISVGGLTFNLGDTDATPAFNLSDATDYPTSSLSGTITNAQLAGSIANSKLANDNVSFGGVSVDLGASDATPAFDLSDATNYPTSSLSGTITNAQLAGSIAASKLGGSIGDSKLSTINTAGKVSGAAITSGTIGGSAALNTSSTIATTSSVAVGQSSATSNTKLDLNGGYAQVVVALSGTSINCALGNYFTKTVGSTTTFSVTNIPSSRVYSFVLEVTHNGGTLNWFSGVKWPDNDPPTLTTSRTHLFVFVTDDGGSTWRANAAIDYPN